MDALSQQFDEHAAANPLRSLAGAVARSAAVLGSHVAVRSGDAQLTYGEVEQRSAKLAWVLADHGAAAGARVGLYLHKSVDSYVAIHSILRAGAAYVPIDPLAPPALVDQIVADCGIEVLISADNKGKQLSLLESRLLAIIGPDKPQHGTTGPVATVSWDEVDAAERFEGPEPNPDDRAYIIYTSGSTGRPKGIVHTHASGLAWAERAVQEFALSPADRMANIAPLHFDISLLDVIGAPVAGATTLLIPEPYLKMPASLAQLLETEAATNWYSAPTAAWQLLHRGGLPERDLSSLRRVILGGEMLPPAQLAELMEHTPNAVYINYYGPAETNGVTSHGFRQAPDEGSTVPIGLPSAGIDVVVVDEGANPAALGEAGEVLISGPTTMQGYWNQPELTAAAFALSPSNAEPDSRWYRTGDLAYFDGENFVFVGRVDHQVKVRGHRVELEGVEAALGELDGVELAVVGIDQNSEGTAVLRAAVTTGEAIDTAALRTQLGAVLPPYAVPASIATWDRFPTTPSGKLDRKTVRAALVEATQPPVQEKT